VHLIQIQEQIVRGEYQVDTYAVAEAIMRRMFGEQKVATTERKRPQEECS
jgi:hypothetical protein